LGTHLFFLLLPSTPTGTPLQITLDWFQGFPFSVSPPLGHSHLPSGPFQGPFKFLTQKNPPPPPPLRPLFFFLVKLKTVSPPWFEKRGAVPPRVFGGGLGTFAPPFCHLMGHWWGPSIFQKTLFFFFFPPPPPLFFPGLALVWDEYREPTPLNPPVPPLTPPPIFF